MHIADAPKDAQPELVDKWILSRLSEVTKKYFKHFDAYEIAKARKVLEQFFYNDFCDNYLEIIKHRLYGNNQKSKASAKFTLRKVLLEILKMWAPIMPHITEEIYQTLFKENELAQSIHLLEFGKPARISKNALEQGKIAIECISEIRKWKQQHNLGMGKEVEKLTLHYPKELSKVNCPGLALP